MKTKLPTQFKTLFWDCKFRELDTSTHQQFIIERLLEKGSWEEVKWIFKNFQKKEIENILAKSPNISAKTKNFWQIIFNEATT